MQKYIGELEDRHEEVAEALEHRMTELESELERTENYSSYYEVLAEHVCTLTMILVKFKVTATVQCLKNFEKVVTIGRQIQSSVFCHTIPLNNLES